MTLRTNQESDIHMAFIGPVKFEESIPLERRFSVIKLHASRLGEESSLAIW